MKVSFALPFACLLIVCQPTLAEGTKTSIDTEISVISKNGRYPIFDFATKLPQGMKFQITVVNPTVINELGHVAYVAQSTGTVQKDGHLKLGPFSDDKKQVPAGKYKLTIGSAGYFLQPSNVKSVIGKNGVNLKNLPNTEEYMGETSVKAEIWTDIQ